MDVCGCFGWVVVPLSFPFFLLTLALPKPPDSLVTSEVTASSVKLSWKSGNTEPIESYVVIYKRKYAPGPQFEELTDIVNTETSIAALDAYTNYEFKVAAVNNIGRGIPSNPVDVVTGEMGQYGTPTVSILSCLAFFYSLHHSFTECFHHYAHCL